MRATTISSIPSFSEICEQAPLELRDYIDRCKITDQTYFWHPEGNCYEHTKIVYNRAKRTGDIDLVLAAFFHDLGKCDVTKPHPTIPNKYSAYGHEIISAKLVEKYRYWIEGTFNANFHIVYYIVRNHMKAKQLEEMRPFKQMHFKEHPYYVYVERFTQFDDMQKDFSHDLDE
jgi:hypothetical protein